MSEITGFCGWRYDKKKVKDLSSVYAPPYDVISKDQQESLYAKNPFNVIRLELGKDESGDHAARNKYTRAGQTLRSWKASGVLRRDERPSIYVYVQDYREEGRPKTRVGFLAAMRIDEKKVLKHENTLAAPKKDRLALIKEVRTNLSPIFGLFEDKSGAVQKLLKASARRTPDVDVTLDGVRHRLYVESDKERVEAISRLMREKPMFIADGHHRFEVACQYKKLAGAAARPNGSDGPGRVMTYFTDCLHNPFKIFPTHRLVRWPKGLFDLTSLLSTVGKTEKVKDLDAVLRRLDKNREETPGKKYTFGAYSAKSGFWLVTLSPRVAAKVKKNPVDKLDVAVLHSAILEPLFGIRAIEKSDAIDFTRDPREAVRRVDGEEFDAAFFLRPTSMKEMLTASKKGLKMPQKSTYFYPKLLSGLAFHSFGD
ncbi:MAG TPA: DUF1015 domain-containing protein [Candidatus Eisenbacteria bacterium]|nr:DUF1015 domain-containing protein [Candidatus Eisenbacteria bacterium]